MNTKNYKKNNKEKNTEKTKIDQISKNINDNNTDINHENNTYLLLNTKLTTIDFNDNKNKQLSFYNNYKQQEQNEILIINVGNNNNNNNIDLNSFNDVNIINDDNNDRYIILENNINNDDALEREMEKILYQKNIINITSNYVINRSNDDDDNFSISLTNKKENQQYDGQYSKDNKNAIKEQYNEIINSTIKKNKTKQQQIYYGDYFICPKEEIDNEEDLKNKSNQYTIGFIVDMDQWLNDKFIIVPSELVYVCLDFKKIIFPFKENPYHCQLYKENAPVKIVATIKNTNVFWI